jgi:copper(I)-binding protein
MALHLHRRAVLRAALASAASAAGVLASPAVQACEFFCPTLRIYLPWARATDPQDKTAQLFMTFDEVIRDDRLIGIEFAHAQGAAMLLNGVRQAVSVPIPAGKVTDVQERGPIVLLLEGLTQPLLLGREYPLTLIFEQGGRVAADIDVTQGKA